MPVFEIPVPVILITGKKGSGKSLFGLTIDPPGTCYYDLEHSGVSYNLPLKDRVNVHDEVRKNFTDGYRPIDLYRWFRHDVFERVKPGKYSVLMIDPISELEDGILDWVRQNPLNFGKTAEQYAKMSAIMHGDMASFEKSFLADLASRVECLVITVHMGQEWAGGKPTGNLKPKGREILQHLAALFLEMRREPRDGKAAEKPWAVVLKSRLAHLVQNEEGDWEPKPILYYTLETATPRGLRDFMKKPANYKTIKPSQLPPIEVLSEDDKIRMRLEIAQAEAEAATAKRDAAIQNAAFQQSQVAAATAAAVIPPNVPDAPPALPNLPLRPEPSHVVATPPPVPSISEFQLNELSSLRARFAAAGIDWQAQLTALNIERLDTLTGEQATDLLSALAQQLPGEPVSQAPATPSNGQPPTPLDQAQVKVIEDLRDQLAANGMPARAWAEVLAKRNVREISELSEYAAHALVTVMRDRLPKKEPALAAEKS